MSLAEGVKLLRVISWKSRVSEGPLALGCLPTGGSQTIATPTEEMATLCLGGSSGLAFFFFLKMFLRNCLVLE